MLNDIECDKNNSPFDSSTNGISYELLWTYFTWFVPCFCTWYHDSKVESTHVSASDLLIGCIIELMQDLLNETEHDSTNSSMDDWMNYSIDNLMNDLMTECAIW